MNNAEQINVSSLTPDEAKRVLVLLVAGVSAANYDRSCAKWAAKEIKMFVDFVKAEAEGEGK